MLKRAKIPDRNEYRQTLTRLIEKNAIKTLIAVRLGAEAGMTRIEIVNARATDLDRIHKRGLWVEVAKKVRRGNNFLMRKREIPLHPNLYQLLKTYVDENQVYIFRRQRGNVNTPFSSRYINTLYDQNIISWSSHKSRHYFKNQIADWMRENRQVDLGLIKELMGHKKTVTEDYGSYSWDYKRDVVDKVFE